jgi:hypothetical protein
MNTYIHLSESVPISAHQWLKGWSKIVANVRDPNRYQRTAAAQPTETSTGSCSFS